MSNPPEPPPQKAPIKGPFQQWAAYAARDPRPQSTTEPLLANAPATSPSYEPDYSTVYFGYGSNLSPRTMKQRCPDSMFIGLGRVADYRWQINSTQYANVVPSPGDIVWGSLFFLSRRDEAMLDQSEGVPWLYEKHRVKAMRVVEGKEEGEVDALCYVDVQRTEDGTIEPDYVVWVNKGVSDASSAGMPVEWVERYIRRFCPAPPKPGEEEEISYVRIMTPLKPKEVIGIGKLDRGYM